jgi:hypothetical protein
VPLGGGQVRGVGMRGVRMEYAESTMVTARLQLACNQTLTFTRREELKRLKEERRAKMQGTAPGFASETARTVRRGLTTVWELLVLSLPRLLRRCAATSAAEWRVWGSTSWGHFKEEMVHYWIGFKLLCAEVLIASRLSYQALQVWCLPLCLPRPSSSPLSSRSELPRSLREPLVPLAATDITGGFSATLDGFRSRVGVRVCV